MKKKYYFMGIQLRHVSWPIWTVTYLALTHNLIGTWDRLGQTFFQVGRSSMTQEK